MADTQPLAPTDAEIDAAWLESVKKHELTVLFVRDFARAVLAKWGAQPVPAGYALVPVEPTSAMLDAAANAGMTALDEKDAGAEDINMIPRMYGAMIAAAPQPVVREPLTRQQLREAFHKDTGCTLGGDIDLAERVCGVVERAHGITGAKA